MIIIKKGLRSLNEFMFKTEKIFLEFTSFSLFFIALVAVFNRFVIKITMAWYEEMAIFLYMLIVFWSLSNIAKNNDHLNVTILRDSLTENKRIYLDLFINLICIIVSIVGLYFSIQLALITTMRTVALRIPRTLIIFSSMTYGFFGLTIRYLNLYIDQYDKLKEAKLRR